MQVDTDAERLAALLDTAVGCPRDACHLDLVAEHLRLETLNVLIKTAHLGTTAAAIVPVSLEVVRATGLLRRQAHEFLEIADGFVSLLTRYIRDARLARLAARGMQGARDVDAGGRFVDATERLADDRRLAMEHAGERCAKLEGVGAELAWLGAEGDYAVRLARIESVRLGTSGAGLLTAAEDMAGLLGEISGEIADIRRRLGRARAAIAGLVARAGESGR
jgi:hypothetical protein